MNCHSVRDDLPLLAAGVLDGARAAALEQHLSMCVDCSDEHELIMLLRTPVALPAGLEGRVRRAIMRPAPVRQVAPWRTVLAATVAVLTISSGALLVMRQSGAAPFGAPATGGVSDAATIRDLDATTLGWAARVDPLLHDGGGLVVLTEEELELLLEEMQS